MKHEMTPGRISINRACPESGGHMIIKLCSDEKQSPIVIHVEPLAWLNVTTRCLAQPCEFRIES